REAAVPRPALDQWGDAFRPRRARLAARRRRARRRAQGEDRERRRHDPPRRRPGGLTPPRTADRTVIEPTRASREAGTPGHNAAEAPARATPPPPPYPLPSH